MPYFWRIIQPMLCILRFCFRFGQGYNLARGHRRGRCCLGWGGTKSVNSFAVDHDACQRVLRYSRWRQCESYLWVIFDESLFYPWTMDRKMRFLLAS
jgi:hypothetical protein